MDVISQRRELLLVEFAGLLVLRSHGARGGPQMGQETLGRSLLRSGRAFLFAALTILQPLYEACIDRMTAFLAGGSMTGHFAYTQNDRRNP